MQKCKRKLHAVRDGQKGPDTIYVQNPNGDLTIRDMISPATEHNNNTTESCDHAQENSIHSDRNNFQGSEFLDQSSLELGT